MKKVVLLLSFTVFILTGCVSQEAYELTKTIYIGGKKVVIANADKLSEETLKRLERLDNYAVSYDVGRKIIIDELKNTNNKNR